jgi:NAD(P)-dependent dehydrogenase (short-subunit alcohol dehydrogenase family)
MKAFLTDSVALVTGANGGVGREFVQQALARGATKVLRRSDRRWRLHAGQSASKAAL